jgi:hypothetical protein
MSNISGKSRTIGCPEDQAWKKVYKDHKSVMAYYDFRDTLRGGLKLYRQIRDDDEAWSRAVQCGETNFDPEVARQFRTQYEAWYEPCDYALECVQHFEKLYGSIEGGKEFKLARAAVKLILATPIDTVIRSMEQIANGDYEDV